jgi:hypothetical protein
VLPNVGHFPQVEAPTEVVELIEDFVATGDRREMDGPRTSFSATAADNAGRANAFRCAMPSR